MMRKLFFYFVLSTFLWGHIGSLLAAFATTTPILTQTPHQSQSSFLSRLCSSKTITIPMSDDFQERTTTTLILTKTPHQSQSSFLSRLCSSKSLQFIGGALFGTTVVGVILTTAFLSSSQSPDCPEGTDYWGSFTPAHGNPCDAPFAQNVSRGIHSICNGDGKIHYCLQKVFEEIINVTSSVFENVFDGQCQSLGDSFVYANGSVTICGADGFFHKDQA